MKPSIRPSALPALDQCVCFQSDDVKRDYSELGTQRHAELARRLEGKPEDPFAKPLDDESLEAIDWAFEYIQMTRNGDLLVEQPIEIAVGHNGDGFKGTVDCRDLNVYNVWDFKWRYRDYSVQMAAYALGIMQAEWSELITVHILFGESMKAVKYDLSLDEAEKIVNDIVAKVEAGGKPTPCEYCNWCKRKATCPALEARVKAIQEGREDWELDNYHGTQIDDPEAMAKALILAREVKAWIEGIEYHAKRLAEKNGGLPGFKLQTRQGRASITNIPEACRISTLPPDDFLAICSVSPNKIVTAVFESNKEAYTSKASAERAIKKALEPVTERGESSISLVKETKKRK